MKKRLLVIFSLILICTFGGIASAQDVSSVSSTTTSSSSSSQTSNMADFGSTAQPDSKSTGEGLTISPPLQELTLKPGESSKQKITITNPTKSLVEIYPSVMNFTASGEDGEPAFSEPDQDEKSFALASWISYNGNKIALTPEQVIDFEYTISVPKDAESGGHYGAIFFSKEAQKDASTLSNQVLISGKIGTLVLVKVPGTLIEKATLDKFYTNKISFSGPVRFYEKMTNLGNVHFKPKGEVTITNLLGNESGRSSVNEAGGNVLPDSTRRFENNWNSSFWSFGRYVANVKLVYGETDRELTGTYVFYILPWWFLVTLGVVAVLLAIGVIWIVRRRRHKKNLKYNIGNDLFDK